MKTEYGAKISALELQLTKFNHDIDNVQTLIEQGLTKIKEIGTSVKNGNLSEVRKDIGSIYPEKIVFDGSKVRTRRRNEFVSYIQLINSELGKNKNGTKIDFSTLSRQVGTTGFEPATPCTPCKCATGLRYVPNYSGTNFISYNLRDPPATSGMRYRAALRPELPVLGRQR